MTVIASPQIEHTLTTISVKKVPKMVQVLGEHAFT